MGCCQGFRIPYFCGFTGFHDQRFYKFLQSSSFRKIKDCILQILLSVNIMEFVCKLLYELTRICNLFLNMYTVPNTIHIDTNVHSLYITFLNIINSTLNSVYLITDTEIFTPSVTVIKHMSVHLSQKLMTLYTLTKCMLLWGLTDIFLSLFPASVFYTSLSRLFDLYPSSHGNDFRYRTT